MAIHFLYSQLDLTEWFVPMCKINTGQSFVNVITAIILTLSPNTPLSSMYIFTVWYTATHYSEWFHHKKQFPSLATASIDRLSICWHLYSLNHDFTAYRHYLQWKFFSAKVKSAMSTEAQVFFLLPLGGSFHNCYQQQWILQSLQQSKDIQASHRMSYGRLASLH